MNPPIPSSHPIISLLRTAAPRVSAAYPSSLYPVRLEVKRRFDKGILAGLTIPDSIPFVSQHSARRWLRGVRVNSRAGRLDYTVTNFCVVLV